MGPRVCAEGHGLLNMNAVEEHAEPPSRTTTALHLRGRQWIFVLKLCRGWASLAEACTGAKLQSDVHQCFVAAFSWLQVLDLSS